jgi:hypothetical protein
MGGREKTALFQMTCRIKKEWIDIEMEHTKNRFWAKKIASDHVKEYGCGYYPALKKMERLLGRKR